MTIAHPLPLKSAVPLTNVYVDGFNLYYGAAKNTPFKWVNLAALCEAVLPGIRIGHIRYFTALVSAMPGDPDHQQRAEDSRWDLQPAHCGYGEAEQCSGRVIKASPSITLRRVSRFTREIKSDGPACPMARSQFPPTLVDAAGRTITKPAGW